MQPLYSGAPRTVARALERGCRVMRNGHGLGIQTCGGNVPIRRHASSGAPPTPGTKKPAPKPLPYQPTQSQGRLGPLAQKHQRDQERRWLAGERPSRRPVADMVRERWIAILGFGGALACLGYFTASLAMYWRAAPAPCHPLGREPEAPTGRPAIQSPYEFDLHLDKSEWRYGITRLRQEVSALARGHVLEVAIGTGRNLEFYGWDAMAGASLATPEEREQAEAKSAGWLPGWGGGGKGEKGSQAGEDGVVSFTGVDISPGMLDIALQRMRQVVPHMAGEIPKKPSFAMLAAKNGIGSENKQGHVVSFLSDRIRLLQSDVQSRLPEPPTLPPTSTASSSSSSPSSSTSPAVASPPKYDTILQTFGLCSVRDPVALLALMASSVQPDTGRIVLLEHGRSVWDPVNGLLDRGARAHHERFGCWWNRDVEGIVHEAARRVPGLEILRLERPGWATAGTHVVVELRVVGGGAGARPGEPAGERKTTGWAPVFPSLFSTKPAGDSKKSG
ncbi:hypothetical protein F4802DRAFT_616905 [Xylaria palmicola]|nr:hypothetical protein F4802DRAFT_616905 [Xylaria palmicola]